METEHWIQYFTNKEDYGEEIPYYFNKITNVTQWDEPEEMEYCFYANPEKASGSSDSIVLPDAFWGLEYHSVFQQIGVDSISNLKHDSIRKLQVYHQRSNRYSNQL